MVLGDVRVRGDVKSALADAEIIFMMAGRSGALASDEHPVDDLQTNCGGLLNVLDVLRERGGRAHVVFPGSRLQYGRVSTIPVTEDHPLAPLVPYGVHKTFCEQYLAFFFRRCGITYAVGRLTNPYGPSASTLFRGYNVLNLMVSKALAGENVTVYGEGDQLRDCIFIDDAINALLCLGSLDGNAVVNVGSGRGHALEEVARLAVSLAGKGKVVHVPWPPNALEVETGSFVADIKAIESLGWTPRYSLEDGLRKTIRSERVTTPR